MIFLNQTKVLNFTKELYNRKRSFIGTARTIIFQLMLLNFPKSTLKKYIFLVFFFVGSGEIVL